MVPPPPAPIRSPDNENLEYPHRPDESETPDVTPPSVTLVCLVRLLTVAGVSYGLLSDGSGFLPFVVAAFVVAELVVAWGVWSLRRWAWSAALGAYTVTAGVAVAVGIPLAAVATVAVVVVLFVHRDRFE